jgi:PiT family inorganic phosphate transporter
MDHAQIFVYLAIAAGFYMAWAIGANDVANAMGTSVGSRSLTLRQAVLVAAVFEFSGAIFAGGNVTETIRKGIIDPAAVSAHPAYLIYGMLSALLAAGTWLLFATRAGWPVSTTHSIVGSVVGFAAAGLGLDAVHWVKVGQIAVSWVTSPLVAGIVAFVLFTVVQRTILEQEDPFHRAQFYAPFYIFGVALVLALLTTFKGLSHLHLKLSPWHAVAIAAAVGAVATAVGTYFIRRIHVDPAADRDFHYTNVERVFAVLQVCTACSVAFAHGSNDVANAVGPLAAVVNVAVSGEVTQSSPVPAWVMLLGGAGILVGLATWGYKIIDTVGHKITELTPTRGFSAELAAAVTIVFASVTGMPVSTTHTLVGAVLGVGLARGIGAIDLRVIGGILVSWLVTLPAGAVLATFFFFFFKGLFS